MAEQIRNSFCEEGITVASILTALSMTISTIVLTVTGFFWGGWQGGLAASGSSSPKNEGDLKKRVKKLADTLRRLAGKAVETLPAIVGSVAGAILSFLAKLSDL